MHLKRVHATTLDSLILLRTPPIVNLTPRTSVHHLFGRFANFGAAHTSVYLRRPLAALGILITNGLPSFYCLQDLSELV